MEKSNSHLLTILLFFIVTCCQNKKPKLRKIVNKKLRCVTRFSLFLFVIQNNFVLIWLCPSEIEYHEQNIFSAFFLVQMTTKEKQWSNEHRNSCHSAANWTLTKANATNNINTNHAIQMYVLFFVCGRNEKKKKHTASANAIASFSYSLLLSLSLARPFVPAIYTFNGVEYVCVFDIYESYVKQAYTNNTKSVLVSIKMCTKACAQDRDHSIQRSITKRNKIEKKRKKTAPNTNNS